MPETVGNEEDRRAFEQWCHRYGYRGREPSGFRLLDRIGELRRAFDAGMERGMEKRGCCNGGEDANASD